MASIISFVGSATIILLYFYLKDLRTFAFKLVCHLSFADLIVSLAKIIGTKEYKKVEDTESSNSIEFCILQAYIYNSS